jgi:dynein heavy chain, axonemal
VKWKTRSSKTTTTTTHLFSSTDLSRHSVLVSAIYLPIETTYTLLDQAYHIPIPRDELHECSQLRVKWSELMLNADRVRRQLLQERRQQLEQELDKQVKSFVVEVIRFRNAFDVEGPNVAGLSPLDAAKRLKDFQGQYKIMHRRKQTLNSISTLFSLQTKQFPELDKTGEVRETNDLLFQRKKDRKIFSHSWCLTRFL